MTDKNEFEHLPVGEGIEIYIEYLIAVRDRKLKKINNLFKKHPDMFQPDTLKIARQMMFNIAALNNDQNLLNLLENT